MKIKNLKINKQAVSTLLTATLYIGAITGSVIYYQHENTEQICEIDIDSTNIFKGEDGKFYCYFDVGEHIITISRNDAYYHKSEEIEGYAIKEVEINGWRDNNKITYINLSFESTNQIKVGETIKIQIEFPDGVQNKEVSYDIDKVGIIDIKADGTIYAIKPGTVKITVTALSGVQETIELSVISNEIEKNNCSGCNQKTIVKQIIMLSSISMIVYLIMKRGAKNE